MLGCLLEHGNFYQCLQEFLDIYRMKVLCSDTSSSTHLLEWNLGFLQNAVLLVAYCNNHVLYMYCTCTVYPFYHFPIFRLYYLFTGTITCTVHSLLTVQYTLYMSCTCTCSPFLEIIKYMIYFCSHWICYTVHVDDTYRCTCTCMYMYTCRLPVMYIQDHRHKPPFILQKFN